MYRALAVPSSAPCAVEVSELLQFPFPSPWAHQGWHLWHCPCPQGTPDPPSATPSPQPGPWQLSAAAFAEGWQWHLWANKEPQTAAPSPVHV